MIANGFSHPRTDPRQVHPQKKKKKGRKLKTLIRRGNDLVQSRGASRFQLRAHSQDDRLPPQSPRNWDMRFPRARIWMGPDLLAPGLDSPRKGRKRNKALTSQSVCTLDWIPKRWPWSKLHAPSTQSHLALRLRARLDRRTFRAAGWGLAAARPRARVRYL